MSDKDGVMLSAEQQIPASKEMQRIARVIDRNLTRVTGELDGIGE